MEWIVDTLEWAYVYAIGSLHIRLRLTALAVDVFIVGEATACNGYNR